MCIFLEAEVFLSKKNFDLPDILLPASKKKKLIFMKKNEINILAAEDINLTVMAEFSCS